MALNLKLLLIISMIINSVLILVLINNYNNRLYHYSKIVQLLMQRYPSYSLSQNDNLSNITEKNMFNIVKSMNQIRSFNAEYWSYISWLALYGTNNNSNNSHIDSDYVHTLIDMYKYVIIPNCSLTLK